MFPHRETPPPASDQPERSDGDTARANSYPGPDRQPAQTDTPTAVRHDGPDSLAGGVEAAGDTTGSGFADGVDEETEARCMEALLAQTAQTQWEAQQWKAMARALADRRTSSTGNRNSDGDGDGGAGSEDRDTGAGEGTNVGGSDGHGEGFGLGTGRVSLDAWEPGAELGAILCQLDPAVLNGSELVEYFGAVRRQIAHLEAVGLKAVNELGYCPPGGLDSPPERVAERHERAVGAIEAHVGWGRRRARSHDDLAYRLVEVFPHTWQALAEGLVDTTGAHAIVDGVILLDDEHLQHRVESTILGWLRRLLADGRRVPAYQIRLRVDREVAAIDPDGAHHRHNERVRHRGLQLRPSVDSVADLLLHDIPADEATAIFAHIDAIARTHKRAGDERTLGQLRADAATSLLAGRATLAECDGGDDCPHHQCGCHCPTCVDHAEGHTPTGCTSTTCRCGCTPTSDTSDTSDTGEDGDDIDAAGDADRGAGTQNTDDARSVRHSERPSGQAAGRSATGGGQPPRVKAKHVLHVPLTTLLGLYDQGRQDPAILGGYGPVITEVAERILSQHLDNPDADYTVVVTHPRTGRPIQIHPVNARLFTGRLRDLIDVRWQHCTWVTKCARPAQMCVGDHSHDHANGGATTDENGNPICDPHDWEKTVHGWKQQRPDRDTIDWQSPFGHSYRVRPDPYTEPTDTETGDDSPPF